jgi:putative thioredoxin
VLFAQLLIEDDPAAAVAMLDALPSETKQDPQIATLLETARQRVAEAHVPAPPALLARIAGNEGDLAARLELAEHFMAQKDWAPAFEQLLEIVRRDRSFQDDIGRKTMIEGFDKASAQPQLVSEWRRRLSSALF